MSEWIRLRGTWLQKVFPQAGPSFPCAATSRNVLRAVDPEQLKQLLMDLLTRVRAAERRRGEQQQVALDGKTLRGTQGHLATDQVKMHQVTLYETGTGILLKEQIVGDKENEQSRVEEFCTPLYVKGRIVSADALHTQTQMCASITASGGDYLLIAKDNQPTLHEDLRLFFGEPPLDCRDWREVATVEKGHGRLEQRELIASTELHEFLAREWSQVGQVFVLRRRVTKPRYCTQVYVYGITSLTPAQADPAVLLKLIREHWKIENRLHWRRDVTDGAKMPVKSVRAVRLAFSPCSTASSWLSLIGLG